MKTIFPSSIALKNDEAGIKNQLNRYVLLLTESFFVVFCVCIFLYIISASLTPGWFLLVPYAHPNSKLDYSTKKVLYVDSQREKNPDILGLKTSVVYWYKVW